MLVLVDTSVWIDLLGKARAHRVEGEQLLALATCPPIIQEVLQGVRAEPARERLRISLLALPRLGDPLGLETYLRAADLYSSARRKGLTVRSSIDCLIAAIALEHRVAVWHADRDFEVLARFTELRTITGRSPT